MSGMVLENPVGISCGHLDMKSLFSSHTARVRSVSCVGGVEREDQGAKVGRMGVLVPRASPLFLKSYPAYMASGITGLQVKITWGFNECPRSPRVQVGVHSTTEEPALGRALPAGPRTVNGAEPRGFPTGGPLAPGTCKQSRCSWESTHAPWNSEARGRNWPRRRVQHQEPPTTDPLDSVSSLALEHLGILTLSEHRQRSQLSPQRPAPPSLQPESTLRAGPSSAVGAHTQDSP